jgi:dihydroflavonol-4-reductase
MQQKKIKTVSISSQVPPAIWGLRLYAVCWDRTEKYGGLLLPDESPAVEDSCITYYHGDVCDIGSLRKLFADTEGREVILIHTAALISIAEKMPSRLYQVNVNGTKNVLRLCMEYNVKRMVHVSSVHAIPELPQGKIITEVDSFSADAVNGGYAKTKAEAAQAVLDAAGKGLDAVIVFPIRHSGTL